MQKQSWVHYRGKDWLSKFKRKHTAGAGVEILREGKKRNVGGQMTVTQVTQTDDDGRKEICPMYFTIWNGRKPHTGNSSMELQFKAER